MRLIGIDPGVSGAVSAITSDGNLIGLWDLTPDPADVYRAILAATGGDSSECFAIVEQQQAMPKQGVSSSCLIGKNYGIVLGVLATLEVPYRIVSPAKWKAAMGCRGKDKALSLTIARRTWPSAELHLKRHHNRAEGLLLAEWGRRNR